MTNNTQNSIENLTKREIEISLLISEGYTTNAIAQKLGIKSNTVSTIKRNVFLNSVFIQKLLYIRL